MVILFSFKVFLKLLLGGANFIPFSCIYLFGSTKFVFSFVQILCTKIDRSKSVTPTDNFSSKASTHAFNLKPFFSPFGSQSLSPRCHRLPSPSKIRSNGNGARELNECLVLFQTLLLFRLLLPVHIMYIITASSLSSQQT